MSCILVQTTYAGWKRQDSLQAILAYLIPSSHIQNNTVASIAGLNPDLRKNIFMPTGIKCIQHKDKILSGNSV